LEFRNHPLVLIDGGSRNRTLVNDQPITLHTLREGDEITVGKTRPAYLVRSEAIHAARPPRLDGIPISTGRRSTRGGARACVRTCPPSRKGPFPR
jgi:hypothetical protein